VLRAGQRCRLVPGQLAELGAVLVTVDVPPVVTPKPRRIWDHEHFEARLEEECARTRGTGGAFAVARIAFEPRPAPADLAFVEAALVGSLAEVDALASYAPAQYQVLLVGRDHAQARAWVSSLAARRSTTHAPRWRKRSPTATSTSTR